MTKVSNAEVVILSLLKGCRFLPGSFDKKFVRELDINKASPLQIWTLYKLGYKYRKQLQGATIINYCKTYLDNNSKPLSRKEAEKILKQALKSTDQLEL